MKDIHALSEVIYSENYQYLKDSKGRYYVTGETIPSLTAVIVDRNKIYKFDPLNASHYFKLIGLTQTGATKRLQIFVIESGKVVYQNWNLTTGEIYYASTNGQLSTVPPVGNAIVMGVALSTTEFLLNIKTG